MNKKLIKRSCKFCKKGFWIYPSQLKYRPAEFCSKKCFSAYRRKRRERICKICSKKFDGRYSNIRYGYAKYCSKKCMGKAFSGPEGPGWKGGKFTDRQGYIWIHKPEHPMTIKLKTQYILEHRLVMATKLKRNLKSFEHVHHKNGVKNDNRPCNLEILISNPHRGYVKCPHCKKRFLIR